MLRYTHLVSHLFYNILANDQNHVGNLFSVLDDEVLGVATMVRTEYSGEDEDSAGMDL